MLGRQRRYLVIRANNYRICTSNKFKRVTNIIPKKTVMVNSVRATDI
jgi:hypothetical protein